MKPKAIIVDVDGTLALRDPEHRGPYEHEKADNDKLNEPVFLVIEALSFFENYKIIVVSARQEKYRLITEVWLKFNRVPFTDLLMRPTKDPRPDEEIKREIYVKEIEMHYDVKFVLDDRSRVVIMWRELGLSCFQVNEGDF